MSRIFYLPTLLRQLEKIKGKEADLAQKALIAFDHFVRTGEKTEGLGFKKLTGDKYEIRAGIRHRVIMKKIGQDYYLALYGDHAAIERFLKNQ